MRWRAAVTAGIAAAALTGGVADAATLSVTSRLQDRREVASGTRAYAIGFEDGRFYANGWHITGEMGGVWTPPLKLVDGVWFAVDGQWIGPATRFTSGWGFTRFNLPRTAGLRLRRIDFAPDGVRGALFGLRITNPGAARTVNVTVDAHSELMTAYPWGFTGVTPNASDNLADHGAFYGRALQFTDDGALPGAPEHHYAALVGANAPLVGHRVAATGGTFRGDQGNRVCTGSEPAPGKMPSECDDGPFGHGTGGQLTYRVNVPAGGTQTLWVAAAGSDEGVAAARQQFARALRNPEADLAAKRAARNRLARFTRVSLPGNPLLQQAIDWGKQNLADLTQSATNLQIRWTNQGKQYPSPLGTVPKARWFGAGFPDYPWLFATDGEYTNFAAVALGQFETAEDHLRALRDVSDILNNRSGLVVHETVSDGSVWFGHDSQTTTTNPDGTTTTTNDFNTDETIKFPSAVALLWRWTGDNAFRDEMYDFAKRNLHYVQDHLTGYHGWPTGSGNVERPGMGPIKLDNAVYYIRGLLDLADMAQSKGDTATVDWARGLARDLRGKFDADFWDAAAGQYTDSLNADGTHETPFQKHWIGEVPQEAELTNGDRTVPGVAPHDHGVTAIAARENSCFSGDRPGSRGLFHTGCGGGADQKGDTEIFSLTTSIMAVGEGNYGRLGAGQQRRYTNANAETMISEPMTGGTPDEQPGAMPEIFPSTPAPSYGTPGIPPNIDRCFTCRSMFMQAWGNYGTAWPVVHQQLGVRPFINDGRLDVVPQVPGGQPSVQGNNIRLGGGAANVLASRSGRRYTTTVRVRGLALRVLRIGATLPSGSSPARVVVDGVRARSFQVRTTNRGVEVTTRARGGGVHTVVVTAA